MAKNTLTLVLCLAAAVAVSPTGYTARSGAYTPRLGSPIPGAAFDRIVHVWLETADYDEAAANADMQWLAGNGILLTNFHAVTHPSQPNYLATVGGDTFGQGDDSAHPIPANISTVVDLLETKEISWGEYVVKLERRKGLSLAESKKDKNLPSSDFQAGKYIRGHSPLIFYESVIMNDTRLARIEKTPTPIRMLSEFAVDLQSDGLPQWAWVTPKNYNRGPDTGLSHAARWLRQWLEPLLDYDKFMRRTLVLVTFNENETYKDTNRVYTLLLGGAVDKSLHGTTDSMYYNHYSAISSISANWGLPSLGRWDCGANVFSPVADRTGYENTNVSSYEGLWWNASYPGPLNSKETRAGWWPRPGTGARCAAGKGVLPSVVEEWGKGQGSYNYTSVYPYDDSFGATKGGVHTVGVNDPDSTSGSASLDPTDAEDVGSPRYPVFTGSVIIGTSLVWFLCAA